MRCALLILLACLTTPVPVLAQALRSLVVPGDSAVAIAPRGQPAPPPRIVTPAPSPPPPPLAAAPLAATGLGAVPLAPAAGLLLPLAAAALLSGTLPGSGGSTGAPATTR